MEITNPLLKSILNSCEKYRRGELDIEGLQLNIHGNARALGGEVSKEIRDFLEYHIDAELESIRFTVGTEKQKEQVLKLIAELKRILEKDS